MNPIGNSSPEIINRPQSIGEVMVRNSPRETIRLVSPGFSGVHASSAGGSFRAGLALFTCLFLAWFMFAADFAEAAPYKGKTKGGSSITFALNGSRVTGIRTVVPTLCLETTGGYTSRAGSELFQPVVAARIGRSVKSKALQPAAMNAGSNATKNYEVTLKKQGRIVSGKLKLNFSFLIPDLWAGTKIFICSGSTSFTSRPG